MKKHFLLIACLLMVCQLSAQSNKKKKSPAYNKQNKENEQFLEKQFWLGLKVGGNLASVPVESSYEIYSPVDGVEQSPKEYERYKELGSQIALEVSFYFKRFSLSFQPTYQHVQFSYTKNYLWTGDESQTLAMTFDNNQKVDHLLLPLLAKYE